MRILMTTIVLMVGLMFATTGFAGDDAKSATETADAAAEKAPAVEAAPPETGEEDVGVVHVHLAAVALQITVNVPLR